jgi:hypothetical protein
MGWPAAFQAAVDAGGAIYPALEVDFPTGTERVSITTLAPATPGPFAPRLQAAGKIARSASDRTCALEGVEAACTYIDVDDRFRNRLGVGEPIDNSVARLLMAIEGSNGKLIPYADWWTEYTGVLYDWEETERGVWAWKLRPNDAALRRQFPRRVVSLADFPNAPTASLGKPWPVIEGHQEDTDSQNGQLGTVVAILVDTVGYRYLVCSGWHDAPSVFRDGVRLSITSAYTISHETVNGIQATLIDLVTDPGTSVVSCDVSGYDTNADGTGDPITEATDVLAHALTNFAIGEYKRGAWAATDALIDATTFAAVKASLAGRAAGSAYACAMQISELIDGLALIDNWGASMQVQPFWTRGGKLGLRFSDPNSGAAAVASIRHPFDQIGDSFKLASSAQDVVKTCYVTFGRFSGAMRYEMAATQPASPTEATESIELIYGPTSYP